MDDEPKKRGRKPGNGQYPKFIPQVAVTEGMRERLDEIVKRERTDMSEIIRSALDAFIEAYDRARL